MGLLFLFILLEYWIVLMSRYEHSYRCWFCCLSCCCSWIPFSVYANVIHVVFYSFYVFLAAFLFRRVEAVYHICSLVDQGYRDILVFCFFVELGSFVVLVCVVSYYKPDGTFKCEWVDNFG